HSFYSALAWAACAELDPERKPALADAIERQERQLAQWAQHCRENVRPKHLLVAAELARIKGQREEAAALYDWAIDAATRERFTQDEALANELAGRFYHGIGRKRIAPLYLSAALAGYARW